MKIKIFLQKSLLLFCSLVFVLIVLEIVLRILLYKQDDIFLKKQRSLRRDSGFVFYKYDRFLGWKDNPLSEGYFTTLDSTTFVKINSKGLRDKEYQYDKQKGVFRILVLGDSFTWGYGVELKEIFTERLENMLGKNAEVLNAGVTGYGTDQEILFLEQEGLKYKPDIVLVALTDNDYMRDNRVDKLGYYPKPLFIMKNQKLILTNVPLPELEGDAWRALQKAAADTSKNQENRKKSKNTDLKTFLKNNTKIYPFISKALICIIKKTMALSKNKDIMNKVRISLNKNMVDLKTTKAMFLRMKEDSEGIGAKLVVFIVPHKIALEKLPSPFIDEFVYFFKQNDIPCLFPYERFLRQFQKVDKLYLNYGGHWNPKGHELAAEELYLFLRKNNLIPRLN